MSKRLKLLLFSHDSRLSGGAERSLLRLVEELTKDHGVDCTVVVPAGGELVRRLKRIGAAVIRVRFAPWSEANACTTRQMDSRLIASFKNLLAALPTTLARVQPDIVYTNTMAVPWGAVTAAMLGKPHVWFVREFGDLDHGQAFAEPLPEILDFIKRSSNFIFTNSEAVRKTLFPGLPPSKVTTAYTHLPVPPVRRKPVVYRRSGALRLLVSGRLSESKGTLDALRAVRELALRGRNVELLMMGDLPSPDYNRKMFSLIASPELQGYVRYLPFTYDAAPIVRQADVALTCSRHEAFGLVTLEAMLLRKAVIGTRTGGTPEQITDGVTGLLYTPGDYLGLAARIDRLIADPALRRKLAETGHRWARARFTPAGYGKKVYRILKRVRGEQPALPPGFIGFLGRCAAGRSVRPKRAV